MHAAGQDLGRPLGELLLKPVRATVVIASFHLHQFDRAENQVPVPLYEPDEVIDLVLVDPFQDHHVRS